MRTFKKSLCLALAIIMVVSVCAVSFFTIGSAVTGEPEATYTFDFLDGTNAIADYNTGGATTNWGSGCSIDSDGVLHYTANAWNALHYKGDNSTWQPTSAQWIQKVYLRDPQVGDGTWFTFKSGYEYTMTVEYKIEAVSTTANTEWGKNLFGLGVNSSSGAHYFVDGGLLVGFGVTEAGSDWLTLNYEIDADDYIVTGATSGETFVGKKLAILATKDVKALVNSVVVKAYKKPVLATGISLDRNTLSLGIGDYDTLIAAVEPTDTTETVVWTSLTPEVATVDQTGKVTAIAGGTATIKAEIGSFSDTCVVTVTCQHSGKTFHPAKSDADCTEQNYSAYYLCTCGQYFAEDGTTEIDGVPYTGYGPHTNKQNHPAKNDATCQEKNYSEYYTCVCGKFFAADGISEIAGIPYTGDGDHSYGNDWDKASSDGDKHYHKCSVCGGLDAGEGHIGGTANCVDTKVCTECDKAYGLIDEDVHKTPDTFKYEKIDETNHKVMYDCCGGVKTASEAHIYDNDDDMICNGAGCGYDRTHVCGNGVLQKGTPAKCDENGKKDSYKCSCGKIYLEATCETLVTSDAQLLINATGTHVDANNDNKCDDCEETIGFEAPETGDNNILVLAVLVFAAATALAVGLTLKKKVF